VSGKTVRRITAVSGLKLKLAKSKQSKTKQKEEKQMPNDVRITVVGNLGADPELRFTPGGNAVTSLNVAVQNRRYNQATQEWEDTGTTWYRVNAWRYLAENVAESLTRGQRVIVHGILAARPWEDKEGNKRESWEITADAIGAELSFATVTVKRATRETAPVPDDPYPPVNGAAEPAKPETSKPETGKPDAPKVSKPARTKPTTSKTPDQVPF
jgi:single-strand DNA-binding protein